MRVLLALCLALTTGCTLTWEEDFENLSEVQLANLAVAETKVDVLETVGPPVDVGLQLNGSVFIYRARREETVNLNLSYFNASFDYQKEERRTERLIVLFDKRGKVTAYGWDSAKDPEDSEEEEEEEEIPR